MVFSVRSIAFATGSALGLPGYPIDCDRSDGPMKKTSMPSTFEISSIFSHRSLVLDLDADERLAIGGRDEIARRAAIAVA